MSILLLMANSTNQVSPSQVSTSLTTVVSSSTLTSYTTYSAGVTQVTSTVTNTIFNGNLPLMGWGAAGCLSAGVPFNANPGDQVTVNFASNVPIDFYLMSAGQFQRVPPGTSLCVYGAIPVFPSLVAASYRTSYSLNWTPTVPGQFFIVLLNLQAAPALAVMSASVSSVQVGSVVVNATATTTITNEYSQVSSAFVTVESTTAAAAESVSLSQTLQWVAVILILVALGVIFLASKKRSHSSRSRSFFMSTRAYSPCSLLPCSSNVISLGFRSFRS
jgi:hypothetical protein